MTDTPANPLDVIEQNLQRDELDWEPSEVGDQVVGFVAGISYVETRNGETPILAIDTKGGTRVKVWAGRTRLRKQLAANKVQPGDAIGIRYEGQKRSKNGHDFFDYKIEVVRVGPRKPEEMFRDDADDLVAEATRPSRSTRSSSIDPAEIGNVFGDDEEIEGF